MRLSVGPGDVTRLAREAAHDHAIIVAAGGDGTVSEVVNGLLPVEEESRPAVGVLPLGTGNDLAHGLGIPSRPDRALEILARGRTRPMDVVRLRRGRDGEGPVEVRAFANAAILGFCGRISDRLPPARRRRWGRFSYLRAALDELADAVAHEVKIRIDGEAIAERASMVIVANGRFAGGRLPLAPRASPHDGRLDLVILPPLTPWRFASLLPRVLAGRQLAHPAVIHRTGRSVSVEADPPMWMNVDGETLPPAPLSLEVLPGVLSFVVP